MLKNLTVALTTMFVVVGLSLAGCSSSEQEAASPSTTSVTADWKVGLDAEVVTALSELSEADRTAALAQKVCPVTDEPLGSMGKPPRVSIEGRDVYLCCAACEEELKNDLEKYLAKLASPK